MGSTCPKLILDFLGLALKSLHPRPTRRGAHPSPPEAQLPVGQRSRGGGWGVCVSATPPSAERAAALGRGQGLSPQRSVFPDSNCINYPQEGKDQKHTCPSWMARKGQRNTCPDTGCLPPRARKPGRISSRASVSPSFASFVELVVDRALYSINSPFMNKALSGSCFQSTLSCCS